MDNGKYIFNNFDDIINEEIKNNIGINSANEEENNDEWMLFLDNESDFDPELSRASDNIEIETESRLTDEDRAQQITSSIGDQYEFTQEEISIIVEIFIKNGWNARKNAVIREISEGTTIEELHLASRIKEIWKEYYEFYSDQNSNYRVLSWPAALCIIRSFNGYPDPEEIEQIFVRLYGHWKNDRIQRNISKTFNKYIFEKFFYGELSEFYEESIFDRCSSLDDMKFLPPSSTDIKESSLEKYDFLVKNIKIFYE